MKPRAIEFRFLAPVASWALVVLGASGALAKPPAAARSAAPRHVPTVLQGVPVATEAKARQIAWHSYILSMRGAPGNGRVQSVACHTLGCNVLDYGVKGEKVWEVRVMDASASLMAIIWVHSATREVKFLVYPEVTMGNFGFQDEAKAAVPNAEGVKGVVIRRLRRELLGQQATAQAITAAQFKEMLSTAEPVSQKEYQGMAFGASDTYKGSFEAPDGIYYFSIHQGIMSLYTPNGQWGRFALHTASPN